MCTDLFRSRRKIICGGVGGWWRSRAAKLHERSLPIHLAVPILAVLGGVALAGDSGARYSERAADHCRPGVPRDWSPAIQLSLTPWVSWSKMASTCRRVKCSGAYQVAATVFPSAWAPRRCRHWPPERVWRNSASRVSMTVTLLRLHSRRRLRSSSIWRAMRCSSSRWRSAAVKGL